MHITITYRSKLCSISFTHTIYFVYQCQSNPYWTPYSYQNYSCIHRTFEALLHSIPKINL